MDNPSEADVTQADREAALDVIDLSYLRRCDEKLFRNSMASGSKDDSSLIQAFAKHRQAAIAAMNTTQSDKLERAREALSGLHRLMLPIGMTLAQAELNGDAPKDSDLLFHFMGSGASDQVTWGEYRQAIAKSHEALATLEKEPK